MTEAQPLVGVIMGSDSDLPVMQGAVDILEEFGVAHEVRIVSAHRTPRRLVAYAGSARRRGLKVIIAGANDGMLHCFDAEAASPSRGIKPKRATTVLAIPGRASNSFLPRAGAVHGAPRF